MSARIGFTPSHLGLCVESLERSLRFYCDGLGFEKGEAFSIGNEYRAALEVEGEVELASQFIRRGALALELLSYRSPGAVGAPSARRNRRASPISLPRAGRRRGGPRWSLRRAAAGTRTGAGDGRSDRLLADPARASS
jgi:catechol 2,3-dioxygenase-like lactoylglutathione lyase family enzyme